MTTIIHETPNRSATIPKRDEKNVLVSGICSCPPVPSAVKNRSASPSSLAGNRQRDALEARLALAATVGRHQSRITDAEACMHDLVFRPWLAHARLPRLGAVFEAHHDFDFRAKRTLVEIECSSQRP
jgi:hypothetical protein